MPWRPSPAEFTAPLAHPNPWTISLAAFGRGIDNAHIDCLLSPRFRILAAQSVRKLVREHAASHSHRSAQQWLDTADLAALCDACLHLFAVAGERPTGKPPGDTRLLLQFALLKHLLYLVAAETRALSEALPEQPQPERPADRVEHTDRHGQGTLATGETQRIRRRVWQHLCRELHKLARTRLEKGRPAALGPHWPVTATLLCNPLLPIPDPGAEPTLVADYPLGWLAGSAIGDWLAQTARCVTQTFAPWLPGWMTDAAESAPLHPRNHPPDDRDYDASRGLIATQTLLERFVPQAEYRQGLTSWLDEPANLYRFMDLGAPPAGADPARTLTRRRQHPDWATLQHRLLEQLAAGLAADGRRRVIEIAYALPPHCTRRTLPLPLVLDYADGRLTRHQLEQRLAALPGGADPLIAIRTLEQLKAARAHQTPAATLAPIGRYLVDFLTLRRDLKLAYKTFETLDAIRLLEREDDIRLSRANASLHEFLGAGEGGHTTRRIRSHAVLKADVRGSTLITEELRARGLNPASHFSQNFFDPVNRLLPDCAAEKLFVEGDAVILGLYEYVEEGPGRAVTRACRLARRILEVVNLQNVRNRELGLPELELGIGISFSRREPNFLYDGRRPIMISSAINQADRLSSCSGLLLRSGFLPASPAFRVAVVRDAVGGERAGPGRDLLNYNVNGVKLDEIAVLKLQEEWPLSPLRLPDPAARDDQFFTGGGTDSDGLTHWIALRHAPVRDWNGDTVGPVEPDRRHYFELIVDASLAARIRQLATGAPDV